MNQEVENMEEFFAQIQGEELEAGEAQEQDQDLERM